MQWLLSGSLFPKNKQFPAKLPRPFYNQSQRRGGR